MPVLAKMVGNQPNGALATSRETRLEGEVAWTDFSTFPRSPGDVKSAQRPRSISRPITSALRCWKPASSLGSRPPTARRASS